MHLSGLHIGILAEYGAGPLTVSNSTFSNNSIGIDAMTKATVVSSTFSNNSDGAIFGTSTMTVSNSTFTNNSGDDAIYFSAGTLTVSSSTFSGNSAGYGGAINGSGNVTVSNSTITGNTATNGGGGIFIGSGGSSLTVTNSTITGNTATNGGGGGITSGNGATVTLINSIVAGNTTTANPGDDCDGCGPQSANNLISTIASPITAAQLMLSQLGSYGGPTQTMIPLPGSPALGQGIGDRCGRSDHRPARLFCGHRPWVTRLRWEQCRLKV